MKRKKPSETADNKSTTKRARSVLFDNGNSRATAVRCTSFPEAVAGIVGEFLDGRQREYVVAALVGVQPITLCLSQDVNSPLGTCWSMGFLPPEHQWGAWNAKIHKQFPITDVEGCLSFLAQTNSNDCLITIEVLVVKLSMTQIDSPSALNDLRNTINALLGHFGSVKHVVFSISAYSSCCFTLNDPVGKAIGLPQALYHQHVLLQIIDDLEICWTINERLTPANLFAFYFTSGIQRASETYLERFVISLKSATNRVLFKEEASRMVSNKIMWIFYLKSYEDLDEIERDALRLCHLIDLDASRLTPEEMSQLDRRLSHASFYENNRSIERFVIKCPDYPFHVKLPRPTAPLTDNSPLSALVELTLKGDMNTLDLTQLNTGYFPHLAHLTFINGRILGHLDSDRVPSLKTLKIETRGFVFGLDAINYPLFHERTQSLIHSGRPWQLVGAKEAGGWSLAYYDEPTTNPQNEEKEETTTRLPFPLIQELLLVMETQANADEFLFKLRGNPMPEAANEGQHGRLLVWKPQCVQQMIAFCTGKQSVKLEFKEPIPEQPLTLTSLTCHGVDVDLCGDALPNLQLLALHGGQVNMSGTFPFMEALSFEKANLQSAYHLDAPTLHSLSCIEMKNGSKLFLSPELVSRLSFLQLRLMGDNQKDCPEMIDDGNNIEFSLDARVVLEGDASKTRFFHRCLVQNVSHLELALDPLALPACWENTVWQCDTLKITFRSLPMMGDDENENFLTLELPPLPRVKKLTVTQNDDCLVLLNTEMLQLAECTLATPRSLGPNLKCPALQRIRYKYPLSDNDKAYGLNHATYEAIGARPSQICFVSDYKLHTMAWDVDPNESQVLP